MKNRRIYFKSSPISYANRVRFLLIHGGRDELVGPPSQSGAFFAALTQARFFVELRFPPPAIFGHPIRSKINPAATAR